MVFNSRTVVRFSDSVSPDTTETYSRKIETHATLENLSVRFYPGQELNLEIQPYRKRGMETTPLVEYQDRDALVGDDDRYTFDITEDLEPDDEVVIKATNRDETYAYDFNLDVEIDRFGGSSRIANFLGGVL